MKKFFQIFKVFSFCYIGIIILIGSIVIPYSLKENHIFNLFIFLIISIFLVSIGICITEYYKNTAISIKVINEFAKFEYYNKEPFVVKTHLCKRITTDGFIIKLFFEDYTIRCFQRIPFHKKQLVTNSELENWFNISKIG